MLLSLRVTGGNKMNIIVNNKTIKLDVKETTDSYIEKYHQLNAQLEDGHKTAIGIYKKDLSEEVYTPEYSERRYTDVTRGLAIAFEQGARKLNEEYKSFVIGAKETLSAVFSIPDKSNDYAVKFANALRLLELEGAGITDKGAYDIIGEFIGDMETMKRFERVIVLLKGENEVFDIYGHTKFPLTFKKLECCREFLDAFDELEAIAENFFLNRKKEIRHEVLATGKQLTIPQDGMQQLMDEYNSKKLADKLNGIIRELFITTD